MGLGRDESVVDDRKKGEDRGRLEEWEDMTEVSILALLGFLQELIGLSPTTASISPVFAPPLESSVPAAIPENPVASRAARAYQTTGRMVHDRNVAPENPPPPIIPPQQPIPTDSSGTGAVTGNFSADEVETIQNYIAALVKLEQKGLESVYLSRSSTFLESIRDAIAAAQ